MMNGRKVCVFALGFWTLTLFLPLDSGAASVEELRGYWKRYIREEVAPPLARDGFRYMPALTGMAGYDFHDGRWKMNEYANQTVHMWLGGLTSCLFGKSFTGCMAVTLEVGQYLGRDGYDLKLADRSRDVAFYLFL